MPSVLIVGVLPYDSGKTTLATSLIEDAVERGIDIGVSKPVSAFNGWYQYEYLSKSVEAGLLMGEDAYRLHESAKSSESIEIESPVTVLLFPPDPEKVGWRSSSYIALTYQSQVTMIRVTSTTETKQYYVPENLRRLTRPLKEEVKKLVSVVNPEPLNTSEIDELLITSREKADECLNYIKRNHELTIVESYNNFAAPTKKSVDSDLVLAVAPSKVAIFKGEDYRRALEVVSSIKEPWRVVTEDLLPLLHPVEVVEFGPGKIEGLFERVLQVLD
ncbi:ATPase [Thermococcus sp. P6]|uniref:ATPase n=1 Tax=Thermococcus sp. P6 TaxID=122420 RepID=UPI000B59A5C0|nr:ATPase [Thermococcus sp. P6]ASJ09957.1 ATPase [Thermococcus sp. P6]